MQTILSPSVSNVTGTRALATPYHNTYGRKMTVSVALNSPIVGANNQALSDAVNPPTTSVGQAGAVATYEAPLVFTVLPGDWYMVNSTDPAAAIDNWVEELL